MIEVIDQMYLSSFSDMVDEFNRREFLDIEHEYFKLLYNVRFNVKKNSWEWFSIDNGKWMSLPSLSYEFSGRDRFGVLGCLDADDLPNYYSIRSILTDNDKAAWAYVKEKAISLMNP